MQREATPGMHRETLLCWVPRPHRPLCGYHAHFLQNPGGVQQATLTQSQMFSCTCSCVLTSSARFCCALIVLCMAIMPIYCGTLHRALTCVHFPKAT
ncbi:hypothetical protein DUNSADRAFT_5015 [Dunaliella salina]|uniref:Encoded protein n=1 Tax=Dunaliella salina TaxID=3046 RepID=A0ABQ7FUH3_DUNSA|nr:hypothetical protein DUNSADRAFT_5015 [Dunaliella salina]|eukprot:KAF5826063.1 hypothetical protein DUNSADRAFT_5015 [Dunaliella salina]